MEALVKFERQSIQPKQTPDFKISNVKDKRWKPKDWLEIELPFKIEAPKGKKDAEFYDQLTVDFYVYPGTGARLGRHQAPDPHRQDHPRERPSFMRRWPPSSTSRPAHSCATPAKKAAASTPPSSNSSAWKSAPATRWSVSFPPPAIPRPGGRFWQSEKAERVGGFLKDKSQTPFAPLWGDYHAEVQGAPGAR